MATRFPGLTSGSGRGQINGQKSWPSRLIMNRRLGKPARNLLVLCLLSLVWAADSSGASDRRLDASDITKPDFFPILPWSPYHGWRAPFITHRPSGLESIADCQFNLAGFVWAQDLRRCRKLGLGAILAPAAAEVTSPGYYREWKKLSDAEIEGRVLRMVRAAGRNPAVKGFYIMDEPGIMDFPALGKAVAAVKKHAPGKLAYINLFPNYATLGAPNMSQLGTSNYTEYLERFVAEVRPQVISYDNYMVQYSEDLREPKKAASYYRNLLEVRRVARAHQLPCLNIVSANQIRPHTPIPSPANLQFQAYTTLAAGYRGITWFNYYGPGYKYTPIDPAGRKTLTWVYLRDINAQVAALAPVMSRLTSTGVFFSAPAPVDGLPLLPGKLVESVACDAPVMVGEFRHADGEAYVMVVNLSLERSARFTFQAASPRKTVQVISAGDGSRSDYDLKNGLWLTAGQGALLALGR